jgi:Rrf2 family protein
MKLSHSVLYAVHTLVDLAGREPGLLCPSHVLAREHGLSERFLFKALLPLVHAGLLESVKGPHGGYRLAKRPKDTTLLEVVEVIDGPIRGEAGQVPGAGGAELDARLQAACERIAEQLRRQLRKVRLSDLAGGAEMGVK